jgi:hypothetical protein
MGMPTYLQKNTDRYADKLHVNTTYEIEVTTRGHLSLVHIVDYCRAVHRVATTVPTYIQLFIKILGKSYSSQCYGRTP